MIHSALIVLIKGSMARVASPQPGAMRDAARLLGDPARLTVCGEMHTDYAEMQLRLAEMPGGIDWRRSHAINLTEIFSSTKIAGLRSVLSPPSRMIRLTPVGVCLRLTLGV